MQLSERIQRVLDEQGLDQPALGKVAGVTKATVNQWITGKIKSLKMEYAVQIQERYGYSVSWLVMGRGPERVSDWPFKSVSKAAFNRLPDHLKEEIEHHMQFVLHRWEGEHGRSIDAAA